MTAGKRILTIALTFILLAAGFSWNTPVATMQAAAVNSVDIKSTPGTTVIVGPTGTPMTWADFQQEAGGGGSGTYRLESDITIPFSEAYTVHKLINKTFDGQNHIITLKEDTAIVTSAGESAFTNRGGVYTYVGIFGGLEGGSSVQNLRVILDEDITVPCAVNGDQGNSSVEAGIVAGVAVAPSTVSRVEVTGSGSLTLEAAYTTYTQRQNGNYPNLNALNLYPTNPNNQYAWPGGNSYSPRNFVALGGIVGHSYGSADATVTECHVEVALNIDGLVKPGTLNGTLVETLIASRVNARFSLGGIVGITTSSNTTISNCYFGGKLRSDVQVGRFFLVASEFHIFNYAAGILGSQTSSNNAFTSFTGTTRINYCVANAENIAASLKSGGVYGSTKDWIRSTFFNEFWGSSGPPPAARFYAYAAAIANYSNYSASYVAGNFVTYECRNGLEADCKESRTDGVYWNNTSYPNDPDGFQGEWVGSESVNSLALNNSSGRSAIAWKGNVSQTSVQSSNYTGQTQAEFYKILADNSWIFPFVDYAIGIQTYNISSPPEQSSSEREKNFKDLTVNDLNDKWKNVKGGGVRLAWCEWIRIIEIGFSVTANASTAEGPVIEIYLIDKTDPLNPTEDYEGAKETVEYQIAYYESGRPATVDEITVSQAPLTVKSVLGYSASDREVTYVLVLTIPETLTPGQVQSITNDIQVEIDEALISPLSISSTNTELSIIAKKTLGLSEETAMTATIPKSVLVGLGYPADCGDVTIKTESDTRENYADEFNEDAYKVDYITTNLAYLGFTTTDPPPEGVTYYYKFAAPTNPPDDPPAYDDGGWKEYVHGAPILSPDANPANNLYLYAEKKYASRTNPSRSEITEFIAASDPIISTDPRELRSGNEHGADPDPDPSHGDSPTTTQEFLYDGLFKLMDVLGNASVNTEHPIVITARYTDPDDGQVVLNQLELMLGRILPAPIITPNNVGETIGKDTKVTLKCEGVADSSYIILYRTSYLAADIGASWNISKADLLAGSGSYVTTWPGSAKKYVDPIPFPENESFLTIWAVAIPKESADLASDQVKMSAVAKISYSSANKETGTAPEMFVHSGSTKEKFDKDQKLYYEGGTTTFSFFHPDLTGEEAYLAIKVNGSLLEKYIKNGDEIDLYKYALASDPSIFVEARLIRTGFQQSHPFEATVNFRRMLNEVTYELHGPNEGQLVPVNQIYETGTAINFALNSRDIPEAYRPGGDGSVTVSSDTSYDNAMPQIWYDIAYQYPDELPTSAPPPLTTANGTRYTPALPRLVNSNGDLLREAKAAEKVEFPQIPHGTKVTVRVQVLPAPDTGDTNAATSRRFSESPVKTLNFTVRSKLEAPFVHPQSTVAPYDEVELDSDNAGKATAIYYTLKGTVPPQMSWNSQTGRYEPLVVPNAEGEPDPELSTYRYELGKITVPPSGSFTIHAMVVSETGQYAPSDSKIFRFAVEDLPPASAVESFPRTDPASPAALPAGRTITLRCATTDVDIYYTLDYSTPVPGQANTFLYDPNLGIPMQPNTGDMQFVITALARDRREHPLRTWSDSPPSTFVYELEKTLAPQASPPSTAANGSIAVLAPGEPITLTCATPNSTIYYTTDNTLPVPGNANTYKYTGGLSMPYGGGAFFTIWAMARVEGSGATAQSDNVRFTYQPPAQVHGVYATPNEGTVVKGTEVRLFTSTSGADIFYEIAYNNDSPDYPEAYASQPYIADKPIIINKDTTIAVIAAKDGIVSETTEYSYELADQVEAPEPSISSGSVVAKGTKLTLSTDEDATIIYTKDGSDPTKTDNKNRMYGSTIALDAEEGKSVSISAYAVCDGMSDSDVVSFSYSISKQADIFIASPAPGSVVELGSHIILTTSLSDSAIHYTLDASDPNEKSPKVTGAIPVAGEPGATFLIKACVITGDSVTPPQVFSYTIMPKTPSPSSSIPTGAYVMDGAKATLTVSEGNIHYTTDGTDPTVSSQLYIEPIAVDRSMVLKAIAVADGKSPSNIVEFIYTRAGQVAAPSASIYSGQVEPGTKIILSTTEPGATIYYSTNGVDPDPKKPGNLFVYDSPITILRPVTIKMVAVKNLMHPSVVNTVNYTVTKPVAPEEETDEGELEYAYDPDRLVNRHDFNNQPLGPKYAQDGILLQSAAFGGLLSAPVEALPNQAVLQMQQITPTASESRAVQDALNFGILDLYDVSVTINGEPVKPAAAVEIGLPIPQKYNNAVVVICHFDDSGNMTVYPTRRTPGMAYAEVTGFSKYALTATVLDDGRRGWSLPVAIAVIIAAGCVLAAGILALTFRKKKRRE